jgi:hypothetical protein
MQAAETKPVRPQARYSFRHFEIVERWLPFVALAAILLYFSYWARLGFGSWFSGDDLLNLYYVWWHSSSELVRGLFLLNPVYPRPLGELFLIAPYHFWGFNPAPWNVLRFVLCAANIPLTYWFARTLSKRRSVGVMVAFVLSFDPIRYSLYFDSGMIYDVLAFLFYYAALTWYVTIRERGKLPSAIQLCALTALFLAALDSKEIAITFPVAILLYELVFQGKTMLGRPTTRGLMRQFALVASTGIISLIFAIEITTGPNAITKSGAYGLTVSLHTYLQTWADYIADDIYRPNAAVARYAAVLLLGSIAIAALLRSRILMWAALMNVFAVLPIAFIPPRNGYAFYVPAAICVLYLCALAVTLLEYTERIHPFVPKALLALLLVKYVPVKVHADNHGMFYRRSGIHAVQDRNLSAYVQLRSLLGPKLKNRRIMFLNHPFQSNWHTQFLISLGWNDRSVQVWTAALLRERNQSINLHNYDYVIDYANSKYWLVNSK